MGEYDQAFRIAAWVYGTFLVVVVAGITSLVWWLFS